MSGPFDDLTFDPIEDDGEEWRPTDREEKYEMAEWVVASLSNSHVTGRELPNKWVWAFARQYWQCLEDWHLDYVVANMGRPWICLDASDVIDHLSDCNRELGDALRVKRWCKCAIPLWSCENCQIGGGA